MEIKESTLLYISFCSILIMCIIEKNVISIDKWNILVKGSFQNYIYTSAYYTNVCPNEECKHSYS